MAQLARDDTINW